MSKQNSPWATFKQEVSGIKKDFNAEVANNRNEKNRGLKWAGLILVIPLALIGLVLLALGFAVLFL